VSGKKPFSTGLRCTLAIMASCFGRPCVIGVWQGNFEQVGRRSAARPSHRSQRSGILTSARGPSPPFHPGGRNLRWELAYSGL